MSSGGASTTNKEPSKVLSLQVSQSAYGTARACVWGTCRVPSNLLGYYDFTATRVETQSSAGGGKGGGGGASPTISYTYSAAMALALGVGVIQSVPRVWVDKEVKTLAEMGFALRTGTLGQSPWAYLQAHHPDEAISYSGIAYVTSDKYNLGDEPSSPQINFEVVGRAATRPDGDAEPADVVSDMLTDPVEGLALDGALLDLADFRTWCVANDYSISLLADSQQGTRDWLRQVLDATVCEVIDDNEKIRIVPLGDEAIGDWQPDTTPVYDITENDVLIDPILRRKQPGDSKNKFVLTYTSRDRDYASLPVTARDITHINLYGEHSDSKTLACITRADMASSVAESMKDRALYQLAEVEMRLDERFILLQPMDIITLTFGPYGLLRFPLRVDEITITEDGEISVTATEWPAGVASPAVIQTQPATGYVPNYNVAPGNANTPAIFEPPVSLAGQPEIWLATSGGANWGGAEVYISMDDATYSKVGVVGTGARHGITTALYPMASDPDNANTLAVDVSVSGAQLMPVTQVVRDLFESLCWVGNAAGGELVGYQGATLTGVGRYSLTNCRRGAYGSQVSAHAQGQQFVRLDGKQFRYAYNPDLIGETLYIKLRSYNKFGGNAQDLSAISPTLYQVKGAPLGTVAGLVLESPFTGLIFAAKWNTYPGAQSYNLEIWSGGALRKSINTLDTRFEATIQQLVSWGAGRTVELRVVAIAFNGQSTTPAVLIAVKPQCAAPTVALQDTASSMIVTASQSADAAYKATRICISQTTGFDPELVTPYYDGPQTAYPSGKIASGIWYVRVAQYDQFGPDSLNWTSQIQLSVVAAATGVQRVDNASSITAAIGSPPPGGNVAWAVYDNTTGKMWMWHSELGRYSSAVSASDIAGQIAASQIAAISASTITGALSDSQLASISAAKVSGQISASQIAAGAIISEKIAAGAVTATEIEAGAINASKLAAGAVTAESISAGAITAEKIAAGSINAAALQAGAVTADKISVAKLAALSTNTGHLFANVVEVSDDGAGDWGILKSSGKWWGDNVNGWVAARSPNGSTLFEVKGGSSRVWMSSWGDCGISFPKFSCDNAGNATFSGTLSAASGTFAGSLSAASGTFGTITAGYLQNSSNTTSLNLNATGNTPFLRAGGISLVDADGRTHFQNHVDSQWAPVNKQVLPDVSYWDSDNNFVLQYTNGVSSEYDLGINVDVSEFGSSTFTTRIWGYTATWGGNTSLRLAVAGTVFLVMPAASNGAWAQCRVHCRLDMRLVNGDGSEMTQLQINEAGSSGYVVWQVGVTIARLT